MVARGGCQGEKSTAQSGLLVSTREEEKSLTFCLQCFVDGFYSDNQRGGDPTGLPLATRMAALQVEQRREAQWHPRV
jgi:hypothetical protein